MITLILKLKDTQIEEFNLGKNIIDIGRSQENDIPCGQIPVQHEGEWDRNQSRTHPQEQR
jgi:hypothetical protein